MKNKTLDGRKVLIADDEEGNRLLFTFILEQEGWEVSNAQDGKEALEKVLKLRPNLLLLDYKMPKLTGGEVYQQLQLKGIKPTVILISSHVDLKKIASSLGISYYLQKPFEIIDFLEMINSACQQLVY